MQLPNDRKCCESAGVVVSRQARAKSSWATLDPGSHAPACRKPRRGSPCPQNITNQGFQGVSNPLASRSELRSRPRTPILISRKGASRSTQRQPARLRAFVRRHGGSSIPAVHRWGLEG